MGKIRTEGVGEVQEFVDIVSVYSVNTRVIDVYIGGLRCGTIEDDEWTRRSVRAPGTLNP